MSSAVQERFLPARFLLEEGGLDALSFQKEFNSAVREAFLHSRDLKETIQNYETLWNDRIHRHVGNRLSTDLCFPEVLYIPSSFRNFFPLPKDLIVDINRGWIHLEMVCSGDFDRFTQSLLQASRENLKREVYSWFYSFWEGEIPPGYFPAGRLGDLQELPLFQEWQSHRKQPAGKANLFILNRFRHESIRLIRAVDNEPTLRRPVLKFPTVTLTRLPRRYGFTAVLFFALILTMYGYTRNHPGLPPLRSSGDFDTGIPVELNDPSRLAAEKPPAAARTAWYRGMGKILKLCSLPYPEGKLPGVFWWEKEFRNRLVLTFDDGPNMDSLEKNGRTQPVTEAVLDILAERGYRAVFFINGRNLESRNEAETRKLRRLLNRMIREGHLLGNHSYHHDNLAKGRYSDGKNDLNEIEEEFLLTQEALDRILGYHYPLILIRPPYAEPGRTAALDRVLVRNRYYLISLQHDSYDYALSDAGYWNRERISRHIRTIVSESDGGVVLMHDRPGSVAILEEFLDYLEKEDQFRISDLSEILTEKYQL